MISEAAKSTRILDIYNMLLRGQAVHKKELAEKYQVNSKSIQRDLESIRDFLSEQYVKCGVQQNVEYDRANDEYRLVTQEVSYLSQGEMLAVSKILLESRAFSKEQIIPYSLVLKIYVSPRKNGAILSSLLAASFLIITRRLMQSHKWICYGRQRKPLWSRS